MLNGSNLSYIHTFEELKMNVKKMKNEIQSFNTF